MQFRDVGRMRNTEQTAPPGRIKRAPDALSVIRTGVTTSVLKAWISGSKKSSNEESDNGGSHGNHRGARKESQLRFFGPKSPAG